METYAGFVVVAIVVSLVIRLMAGGLDGDRVERYVRDQGWELVDRSWDPFGPGWFGEKDSRIYQIVYRDQRGDLHRAHVKTSMLSGVYLTRDQIVERAEEPDQASGMEALVAENARLREHIEALESERG